MADRWETVETVTDFIFMGSKITAEGDCSHEIKRHLLLGRKSMTNLDSTLKNRDITLPTKVCLVKATVFPVVMYTCESWTIKKAEHQRIDAFQQWFWRRLLRDPWAASRSNQSINPKGNQSWIFSRRTDAEAEVSIVEPHDAKSRFIRKDPDAGKDWRQEEKGVTADEMVGWHHRLNGHEFEQAPRDDEGQGSLVCRSLWGHKSHTWLSYWTTIISAADTCLSFPTVLYLKYFSTFVENKNLGGRPPLTEDRWSRY